LKIFVIDDDMISRMALIDVIESTGTDGFQLVEFESGDAAWAALQGKDIPPAMVCCDVRMPGISGIDLLRNIRGFARTQEIPFVLISSANDADTIKSAASLGVTGFIVKPFAHDDAIPRMTKALSLARNKAMESPTQTIARLKLTQDRYLTYLNGLRSQIKSLAEECNQSDAGEALVKVKQKCDALKSACTTLGLWRSSQLIEFAKKEAQDVNTVLDFFSEITQHIHYQTMSTGK
jgi:two-component system chemotaxis response regulator CheY